MSKFDFYSREHFRHQRIPRSASDILWKIAQWPLLLLLVLAGCWYLSGHR